MNSTPREGGGALDVERLLDSIESGDVTPRYTPLDIIRLAEELNALTSGEPFDVSEVRSPGDGTGASHYMAALVADSAALVGVEDLEAGWLFSPRPFPFAAPVGSTDPDDWPGLDGDDWRAEASSAFKQAAEVFGTRRRRWADLAAYESALVRELGEAGRAWDRAFGTLRGLFWGTWGAAVVSEGWTAETTGLDTFAWSENVPDALRQYLDGEGDTSAVITRPSSWTPGLLHVWNSAIAATHSEDVWTGRPLDRLVRVFGLPARFGATQAGTSSALVHEAGVAWADACAFWLRLAAARFLRLHLIRPGGDEPTAERFSGWVAEKNRGGAPRDATKLRRRLLALRDILGDDDSVRQTRDPDPVAKLADLERALEAVLDEAGDRDAEGRSVIRQIRRYCASRGVGRPGSHIADWIALARQITPAGTLQSRPDTT